MSRSGYTDDCEGAGEVPDAAPGAPPVSATVCEEWCGSVSDADNNGAWEHDDVDFCTYECAHAGKPLNPRTTGHTAPSKGRE
jgi:hypothetical protein